MPQFCDVALPVPLESVFSYRLDGTAPAVGARVLVPFRKERLVGVVTRLHDSPPAVEIKPVTAVLDEEPALSPALLELGEWIARYYIAPLGEVLRAMLPLVAEFRRAHVLRITASGQQALYQAATGGSSLRSRKPAEEQADELRLLDYLANREEVREATLRSLFPGSRAALVSLARKKWIEREDVSATRQAGKFVSYVILNQEVMLGRQTEQQRMMLEALRATGGRAPLEAMRAIFPSALATLAKRGAVKIERERVEYKHGGLKPPSNAQLELTAAQRAALQRINAAMTAGKFHVALLHGVTGSGKTAVYLVAMQAALAAGRTAILLVPEIGLTPAAAAHLAEIFGDAVAILHSALTADERAQQWRRIRSGDAKIVVGTRSAVFAPVERPALIVVDEEQDSSYKQEETPRYHGRDVAVMRGKIENAVVVLVSATPSLESFYNTQQGRYELIELTERVEQRAMPRVELVDMRQEFQHTGEEQIFSRRLSEEVRARLERGEQAIILLNRRGYSPVVLCRACGESVQCRDCAITLTYHKRANQLECHYCGYRQAVPRVCPKCGSEHVFFLGSGSEKLEEQLHAEFPRARIGRLDRDTVRRRGDFERVLGAFHAGEIDLLVGTQMIAKGHDVHGVTLAGVVGADFALGFPDFRAAERTFQLLTQVAGRAGRGAMAGEVILQTYFPEHYAIQFAAQHDYAGFSEKELRYRKWMNYPPFTTIANVLVRSGKLDDALKFSGALGGWLDKNKTKGMRVMGPAAAPLARLMREYRYHFIMKSESRERLNAAIRGMLAFAAEKKIPRANVIVDIDPVSLL